MPQPESFARCACQHCGGHIEFPIEAVGRQINCPHCQWPTLLSLPKSKTVEIGGGAKARKRSFINFGIAALGIAAAAGLAFVLLQMRRVEQPPVRPVATNAVSATNHPSTSDMAALAQASAPPPKPKPPVDLWDGLRPSRISLEKAAEGSLIYAVGTLTNSTAKQRFGVKVELEIMDEHKKKIGSATDYTDVIEPGKVWKFRALVTYKNAGSARFSAVSEAK